MKNKPYSPDLYFENLQTACVSPFEGVYDSFSFTQAKAKTVKQLSNALSLSKIPLRTEKLAPVILNEEQRNGYKIQTVSVEICQGLNMLCYLLLPKENCKSGIVALCGHGYGARQIIRQSKKGKRRTFNFFDNYQKNFAEVLAKDGHAVIVPELIGFGEARLKKDSRKPFYASSCDTISNHSLIYGFSTASMRIYQAVCCVSILKDCCFCEKIGCMGISGGGLVALYTSCVDKRITKTCVCGYINTFKTSILKRWHCPDNYIPGIYTIGDMYDFAGCIAPRKLMMQSGRKDKLFNIDGSFTAIEKIMEYYDLCGAQKNFIPVVFDGKHEVSIKEAVEFFKEDL